MPAKPKPAAESLLAEIARLRGMTVGELRARWRDLNGEEARSRNKEFLFRRLAWRVQELAYGGLSDRAKARAAELAGDAPLRIRPPKCFEPTALAPPPPKRDPRLPKVGTVLVRQYHGREIRVAVRDDGFEWNGRMFDSLTAVARAITGQHWNGRLFFGLTARSREA